MPERDPNWADEELRRELDSLPSDIEEQREAAYGDLGIPEKDLYEEEEDWDDDEEEEDFDLEDEFEHDFGFGEELDD